VKPNEPVPYDRNIVMALRSLSTGSANEGQQKAALDWIITKAANLYDMSYRLPEDGGEGATNFHEGRRFVGNQIVKMLTKEVLEAVTKREKAKEANSK
jgi:hypothetical protein